MNNLAKKVDIIGLSLNVRSKPEKFIVTFNTGILIKLRTWEEDLE